MNRFGNLALTVGAVAALSGAGVAEAQLLNLDGTPVVNDAPEDASGSYDVIMTAGNANEGPFSLHATDPGIDRNVNYDGVPENIQNLVNGVRPSVTESLGFTSGGAQILDIVITGDGDLWPLRTSGNTGDDLSSGGAFIGGFNPIDGDWGRLYEARVRAFAGGGLVADEQVAGPSVGFDRWDGTLNFLLANVSGIGVDRIEISVVVGKGSIPAPGALGVFGLAGLAAMRRRR